MRGAGVAQRHRGAGQQHRVLSHAPAPDHGGDPERGDDPDATQPVGGEQGQDGQAAQPGVDHQRQRPPGEAAEQAAFEPFSSARVASDSAPVTMSAAWARRVK